MTIKKVFKAANTNNFGSTHQSGEQQASVNKPTNTVSAKTLADALKTSANNPNQNK